VFFRWLLASDSGFDIQRWATILEHLTMTLMKGLIATVLLAVAANAHAHAHLTASIPADGSTGNAPVAVLRPVAVAHITRRVLNRSTERSLTMPFGDICVRALGDEVTPQRSR
jgi:hypothetical protein